MAAVDDASNSNSDRISNGDEEEDNKSSLEEGRQHFRESISGVLFSRSVRSSFASLMLLPPEALPSHSDSNGDDGDGGDAGKGKGGSENACSLISGLRPILVRLQFLGQATELRSFCRRAYKLGDLLEISVCHERVSRQVIGRNSQTEWKDPRIVLSISSAQESNSLVKVQCPQFWTMPQCQIWQRRFCCKHRKGDEEGQGPGPGPVSNDKVTSANDVDASRKLKQLKHPSSDQKENESSRNHGGGGLGKRLQGEQVARFLINALLSKCQEDGASHTLSSNDTGTDNAETTIDTLERTNPILMQKVIDYLNSGSGVMDIAGGSGHVSMALGLAGVKSTVIDARPTVGKLPGRDRKLWNRALKRVQRQPPGPHIASSSSLSATTLVPFCLPVVPFESHRAWFASRPDGVDSTFRHPDKDTSEIPVCDAKSTLLQNASALVALHPDEATGDVVKLAVKLKIPFVIVPCCVFARLFPQRRKKSNQQKVSTYDDLVEYLTEQHLSIQSCQLPFEGKNTVLWSTFDVDVSTLPHHPLSRRGKEN